MREMKESGIEWIGDIPKAWETKPIRAVFNEVIEKNHNGLVKTALKFTYGNIVRKNNFDADEDNYVADTILNYTIVHPGTIMLNGLNLNFDFVTQRIALVTETGVITSAYIALEAIDKSHVSTKYFTYLFKCYDGCKALHNMGGGVRKILNFSEFKKYYIFVPSLSEQQRIANFLDFKCAEIDALTADIQLQIDTLEEYKRSLITETVTKGLNPDVEMKDSGVEFIGKIPINWNLTKLKYVGNVFNGDRGKNYPSGDDLCDEGIYFLTSNNLHSVVLDCRDEISKYISPERYKILRGAKIAYNDLIFCLRGSVGNCSINKSIHEGTIASSLMSFRVDKENPDYVNYVLQTSIASAQTSNYTNGSCAANLSAENVVRYYIPAPPLPEQKQIAIFLDSKCTEIDNIIEAKNQQIDTLEEYKKSLIFEYVTGKKEVPAV